MPHGRRNLDSRGIKELQAPVDRGGDAPFAGVLEFLRIGIGTQHPFQEDVEAGLTIRGPGVHPADGATQIADQRQSFVTLGVRQQVGIGLSVPGIADNKDPAVDVVREKHRTGADIRWQRGGELIGHDLADQSRVIDSLARRGRVLEDDRPLLEKRRYRDTSTEHHRVPGSAERFNVPEFLASSETFGQQLLGNLDDLFGRGHGKLLHGSFAGQPAWRGRATCVITPSILPLTVSRGRNLRGSSTAPVRRDRGRKIP